ARRIAALCPQQGPFEGRAFSDFPFLLGDEEVLFGRVQVAVSPGGLSGQQTNLPLEWVAFEIRLELLARGREVVAREGGAAARQTPLVAEVPRERDAASGDECKREQRCQRAAPEGGEQAIEGGDQGKFPEACFPGQHTGAERRDQRTATR